ncbi:MAG: hypothetical protein QY321_03680 [Patescibacteria group bacterium]|nr:MAG: hypothetical protein QY321_03680 [Patescibacteria group bacterium]
MSILIGLIMIVIGSLIVIKSEAILNTFGRMEFFEDKLGTSGGSRLGYKLIGIIITFLGILTLTGLIQGFIMFILSPILRYNQ